MSPIPIRLIVGLGNPGTKFEKTRHNMGIWFIQRLLQQDFSRLKPTKKFHGLTAQVSVCDYNIDVLIPTTYMNDSGLAVGTYAKFYKIPPQAILIAHDELDLPVGIIRLKHGGGLAGHNGLSSIKAHLGTQDFNRIRIGIGRGKIQGEMKDYVLSQPSKNEQQQIEDAIDRAIDVFPFVLQGDFEKAMNHLHSELA